MFLYKLNNFRVNVFRFIYVVFKALLNMILEDELWEGLTIFIYMVGFCSAFIIGAFKIIDNVLIVPEHYIFHLLAIFSIAISIIIIMVLFVKSFKLYYEKVDEQTPRRKKRE